MVAALKLANPSLDTATPATGTNAYTLDATQTDILATAGTTALSTLESDTTTHVR